MSSSMTGYASAQTEVGPHQLVWELRSVNHRYLDIGFRLPEELRRLEPRCKEAIGGAVRRGKVDATLKLGPVPGHPPAAKLDQSVLRTLAGLEDAVSSERPEAAGLSVGEILRWPGILVESRAPTDEIDQAAIDCLRDALADLKAARQREGARLADLLLQRCAGIRKILAGIRPQLTDVGDRYRAKLLERLQRFELELEPDRLEQEVALIAQRLDVAEELDRLESHLHEVEATLGKDEAVGRRLDFIIQELNREANTFASKVQDEELSRLSVELKVLIEQMREQVQNLE